MLHGIYFPMRNVFSPCYIFVIFCSPSFIYFDKLRELLNTKTSVATMKKFLYFPGCLEGTQYLRRAFLLTNLSFLSFFFLIWLIYGLPIWVIVSQILSNYLDMS